MIRRFVNSIDICSATALGVCRCAATHINTAPGMDVILVGGKS